MNCPECRQLLQQALDGDRLEDRLDLDQHLAACPVCRDLYAAAQALEGSLRFPERPVPPACLADRIVAQVLADRRARLSFRRRLVDVPTYSERGFRYWRQLPDGRLLAGGFRHHALEEEVGYETVTTARVQGLLEGEVRRLGAQAPIATRWSGIMGFTETELPIVGQVAGRPGVWVCAHCCCSGFSIQSFSTKDESPGNGRATPGWSSPAGNNGRLPGRTVRANCGTH